MEILITALVMGLAGAGHCAAMCGSLSVAAGFSIPKTKSFALYAIYMSLGRVVGYGLVGAVFFFITQTLLSFSNGLLLTLPVIAALLMFGVGLHILKINHSVLKTEKLGKLIDVLLIPLKKKLFPIDSIIKALSYGFLWGFLPCGLVYTALSLAITANNVANAFLIMILFGIGTLPTLVGLTAFSAKLNAIINNKRVNLFLGILVLLLATMQLVKSISKLLAYF